MESKKFVLLISLAILIVGVLALTPIFIYHYQASHPELPVLGHVPPFELTDSTGQPFQRNQLAGKIWVADFFFTTCTGPCPIMSRNMSTVQERLQSVPDVALVSITINPEYDTPEVLRAYAADHNAQPGKWHFLTGPMSDIYDLATSGFLVAASTEDANLHSTRFILVDRQFQIRGYYTGTNTAEIDQLVADLKQLLEES